jgi:hypothetical protein
MAARKSAARKRKTTKKSAARRKPRARKTRRVSLAGIEKELPTSVKEFSRQARRDLNKLEAKIEKASRETRRRLTRVLRDVSRELGRLEAQGQKRWRALTVQTRRDAIKALRRLEKAIEPPRPPTKRKKAASRGR